jgi:hypothetical protein
MKLSGETLAIISQDHIGGRTILLDPFRCEFSPEQVAIIGICNDCFIAFLAFCNLLVHGIVNDPLQPLPAIPFLRQGCREILELATIVWLSDGIIDDIRRDNSIDRTVFPQQTRTAIRLDHDADSLIKPSIPPSI